MTPWLLLFALALVAILYVAWSRGIAARTNGAPGRDDAPVADLDPVAVGPPVPQEASAKGEEQTMQAQSKGPPGPWRPPVGAARMEAAEEFEAGQAQTRQGRQLRVLPVVRPIASPPEPEQEEKTDPLLREALRRAPALPEHYQATYLSGMALAPGRFYLYWEIAPQEPLEEGEVALRLTDMEVGEWRLIPLGQKDDHRWVEVVAGRSYLFELGLMDWETGRWIRTLARWGPARSPGPMGKFFPEQPAEATGAAIGWSPVRVTSPGAMWGLRS